MNIDILLKEFEEMHVYEERARNFYSHYAELVDDRDVKRELASIRDDEKMHVGVVEKLIEIVKKYDERTD